MPGRLKVRVMAARDLPVMDRASELTDAFVEVKFGSTTYKTDVCRKSLNPQWNSEWYRFEVEDEDLQDEPLQIRVLDHDTYSAHDAIGKVYIDLNPLLTKDKPLFVSGWFPIYDTMHGIRGELHVIVKVELFTDFNKFRQSSCGVRFFCSSGVPHGFRIHAIYGFVEELVVNDDPEYQWIDKIRSMRASNEARQAQFSKLSGRLQRKIGLKILEMGGNAVIGYRQCFDLEGESGIVVRAIGTSVTLTSHNMPNVTPPHSTSPGRDLALPEDAVAPSSPTGVHFPAVRPSSSPVKTAQPTGRRSSDSDIGTPPKGSSSSGSGGGTNVTTRPQSRPVIQQESIEMLEYPFFSVQSFPPGFLIHLGGVVSARSVKLLDRIHNPDEPETRDAWWTELRREIRSHMRAMGCNAVLGYSENTTICDEIIVLSACGTAATASLQVLPSGGTQQAPLTMSLDRTQFEKLDKDKKLHVDINLANQMSACRVTPTVELETIPQCSMCHIPFKENSLPFPVHLCKCAICRRFKVPDVLFTTIEPPTEMPLVGRGCLIQARICRPKKESKGETNAKEVSDALPFMEIELHNQLLNKLKVKGMNAIFGLKVAVCVGERLIVVVATATAAYCCALPPPPLPKILTKGDPDLKNGSLSDMQRRVRDAVNRNRERYSLYVPELFLPTDAGTKGSQTDDSEDEQANDTEMLAANRDTFVLEIDDAEDAEIVSVLLDPPVPEQFNVSNTDVVPGLANVIRNVQMFTRVWRGRLNAFNNREFSGLFDHILRSLFFKLRSLTPCALCGLRFDVDIPEEDEVQVTVSGVCCGLGEPPSLQNSLVEIAPTPQKEDPEGLMFQMDTETPGDGVTLSVTPAAAPVPVAPENRLRYHSGPRHRVGVDITPLSHVPGARVDQYLGHLNFFIIRETTSVREEGGLDGFLHGFLSEVMAILRAHVAALGGNALVAYQLTECVLEDNLHKNQSQCLVNVCGDVVKVYYNLDLQPRQPPGWAGSARAGSVSPQPAELQACKRGGAGESPKSSPPHLMQRANSIQV